MFGARLNLPRIERAQTGLLAAIDPDRSGDAADVTRRMMAGYARVDRLLAERIDLYDYGRSREFLELNHLVLCGADPARRALYRGHIEATETAFYADEDGALRELGDWLARARNGAAQARASGAILRIAGHPQLFIEGNVRTAILVASYVLARARRPPLVLDAACFGAFGQIAEEIRDLNRRNWRFAFRAPFLARRIERFIEGQSDAGMLLLEPAASA